MRKRLRGFTLIEVLMVIAITSLMATIVMGSVNVARDKAHVAAMQKFSSNIEHVIGNNLFRGFEFNGSLDEIGGTVISYENAGTPEYVPGIFGQAFDFSEPSYTRDRIRINGSSLFDSSEETIEVFFKRGSDTIFSPDPEEEGNDGTVEGLLDICNYRPEILLHRDGEVRVSWVGSDLYIKIPYTKDKWHQLVFVWVEDYKSSGIPYYEAYLDGVKKESGNFTLTGTADRLTRDTIFVGGTEEHTNFKGYMERFRVYDEALFDND